jgi:hypothetical protein
MPPATNNGKRREVDGMHKPMTFVSVLLLLAGVTPPLPGPDDPEPTPPGPPDPGTPYPVPDPGTPYPVPDPGKPPPELPPDTER